jgi:hypothetical protein
MAKTAAERQREYRQRRVEGTDEQWGAKRINAWVSYDAYLALKRLARHHGITQEKALEQVLREADRRVGGSLADDRAAWEQYYSGVTA